MSTTTPITEKLPNHRDSPSESRVGFSANASRHTLRQEFLTSAPLFTIDALMIAGIAAMANLFGLQFATVAMVGVALFVCWICGMYDVVLSSATEELRSLSLAMAVAIGTSYLTDVNWTAVFTLWILASVATFVARRFARKLLSNYQWWRCPTHVVCSRPTRQAIRHWLDARSLPFRIVPEHEPAPHVIADDTISLTRADGFSSLTRLYPRTAIVQVHGSSYGTTLLRHSHRLSFRSWRLIKRSMDLAIVSVSAPIWLPVMAVLAAAVKLSSEGPVFYSQERAGFGGSTFHAWKFRSMVANADRVLGDVLASDVALRNEWQIHKKLKRDPRVTRIGAWLRETSLDELPQLFNILRGEMSLVGPRPIPAYEAESYKDVAGEAGWQDYCTIRPGLTGLWQVSGRNNTSYEDRIGYDQAYIHNWSIWSDGHILMRTIKTALCREGAY